MSGKLGDFQKKIDEAQPLLQTRCIMIREIFGEASLNPIMEDRQIFGKVSYHLMNIKQDSEPIFMTWESSQTTIL